MNKILFGILNWNRPEKNINNIIENLSGELGKNIFVATNNDDLISKNGFINSEENVAKTKNKFLRFAHKNDYKHCFIIEDDVIIKDKKVFQKYIDLMNKFDLNLTMYGYHGDKNKVLDKRPNPCIIIKVKKDEQIYVNRFVCSGVMGFKILKKEKFIKFDENLKIMETEYLLDDMTREGKYPFNGFFIDLNESWKYFDRTEDKTERNKNPELSNYDFKIRQEKRIELCNNADEFLNYVRSKIKSEEGD